MSDHTPISSGLSQANLPVAAPATSALAAGELVDCWSRVGVYGDGSCDELVHHVHCRNCPVYSAAAARILDRPLPAEYRHNWTGHFSQVKNRVVPGTVSVVIFRIGGEWLALPTPTFQEVVEQRRIHSLPHRRESVVLGLINVRGELLICVCLGRLLGIATKNRQEELATLPGRLAVAEWQGGLVTFPVDEVHGIHRFNPEELQAPPATVAKASPGFTRGILPWQNRLVGCLDEDIVFSTLNRDLS